MLLLSFSFIQTQATDTNNHGTAETAFVNGSPFLRVNQFLTVNQYLQSWNRKYKLIYQNDGNLVAYLVNGGNLSPIWSSKTNNTTPGKCIMQSDGNLVIYDASNNSVWSSKTWGNNNQGIFANLRNDGNFVVKRPNYQLLWESESGQARFYGGSVLYGGQILRQGQRVESNDRKYFLNYQHDGNLVLYKAPNQVLWAANTHVFTTSVASLLPDGEFVIFGNCGNNGGDGNEVSLKASTTEMNLIKEGLKDSGTISNQPCKVWSSGSGNRYNRNVRLVVETNGKVAIYSENRKIWWRPLP